MITIELTGEDALKYIASMTKPEPAECHSFGNKKVEATETRVSARVQNDSIKAKDFNKSKKVTHWSEQEIEVLRFAANLNPKNRYNRKLSTIASKINRTESAIRNKAGVLGLTIQSGMVFT